MTTENKIKCVLMDFEINKITLQEATEQILLLMNAVGQSEQLPMWTEIHIQPLDIDSIKNNLEYEDKTNNARYSDYRE